MQRKRNCFSIRFIFLITALLFLPCLFGLNANAAEQQKSVTALEDETVWVQDAINLEPYFDQPNAPKLSSSLPDRLIPGGNAFGVKMYTRGVWIVGFSDVLGKQGSKSCPAKDCGLLVGDVILAVNGINVNTADELTRMIESCGGNALRLSVNRGKNGLSLDLVPVKSDFDGVYRAGFWIRDNTAGIGTVTYIDPSNGAFGGLGHGICDAESGRLIPFADGAIIDVSISGVVPGKAGVPGELKGYFRAMKTGSLLSNTNAGVFGIFADIPAHCGDAIEVAQISEVKKGEATIRCTLDDGGIREYTIRIDEIHADHDALKNYEITVTDPDLLRLTGGIVQGMSGSPIIQNGKLVGAVTHVLVNDPARGFGIYIGNMLSAA